jgi:anion-transporting  ArsA/GET3 family ATPase
LLRLLTVPYRSRFADVASRPFYYVADRIIGSQFLQDIAEFFILFQTLSEGFVARAKQVERLLRDRRTTFIVVSTLETVPVREAETFMGLLPAQGLHLGGLVLNRVLPTYLLAPGLGERAGRLCAEAGHLASGLCSPGGPTAGADPALVERVLAEVGTNFNNIGVVAKREASQRSELARLPSVVASVPELEDDVHDLAGVLELGRHIWSWDNRQL